MAMNNQTHLLHQLIYNFIVMFPTAVTCGNTYILKPSEKDLGASIMLAELAMDCSIVTFSTIVYLHNGIIVFASVMATLGLQILFESNHALLSKVSITLIILVLLILGTVLKPFVLMSFIKSSITHFQVYFISNPETYPHKERWMIGIMVNVIVVKFMLMVYCRNYKNDIVQSYAQDHFFDVITNSVGLATAVLAIQFFWWIDLEQ